MGEDSEPVQSHCARREKSRAGRALGSRGSGRNVWIEVYGDIENATTKTTATMDTSVSRQRQRMII